MFLFSTCPVFMYFIGPRLEPLLISLAVPASLQESICSFYLASAIMMRFSLVAAPCYFPTLFVSSLFPLSVFLFDPPCVYLLSVFFSLVLPILFRCAAFFQIQTLPTQISLLHQSSLSRLSASLISLNLCSFFLFISFEL